MSRQQKTRKATPLGRRRTDSLGTLSGLLVEAGKVYRKMRAGKLLHEEGRSLVWVLSQMRAMVEAQHLQVIEGRLKELSETVQQQGWPHGHDRTASTPHITH